jgi:hypothetical protein
MTGRRKSQSASCFAQRMPSSRSHSSRRFDHVHYLFTRMLQCLPYCRMFLPWQLPKTRYAVLLVAERLEMSYFVQLTSTTPSGRWLLNPCARASQTHWRSHSALCSRPVLAPGPHTTNLVERTTGHVESTRQLSKPEHLRTIDRRPPGAGVLHLQCPIHATTTTHAFARGRRKMS